MNIFILVTLTLLGSIISLLGGLLLLTKRFGTETIIHGAMALGAGALLGAAFLDLLPDVLASHYDVSWLLGTTLAGFGAFFMLERSAHWFHHHHTHDDARASQRLLVVIGNAVHNAVDGVAIGAAYTVSPALGIVTIMAVSAHEVPREVGDFGILLGKGMAKRSVVLVHVLSNIGTIIAAVAVYLLGNQIEPLTPFILAAVAGGFIYIAASDIIPDIHERPRKEANIQTAWLLIGMILIPSFGYVIEQLFGIHP